MLLSAFIVYCSLTLFVFGEKATDKDPIGATLLPMPSKASDEAAPDLAAAAAAIVTKEASEDDDLDDIIYFDECEVNRKKKDVKSWDHWGKWSPCSVSCGVGKMTRWRHCVSEGCSPGEKEAQIKTCTLSPCQ